MKKNIIRRGASILAVLVMLLTITGCGAGKSAPVDKFFDGMEECDADLLLSAFPEEFVELAKSQDMDEYFEEMLEELEDEYGKFKITYEITDEEELDEDDLDDLCDMMEMVGIDGDEITEAWEIEVEATIKADGEEEDEDFTFVVFKLDGEWYLDPTSMF